MRKTVENGATVGRGPGRSGEVLRHLDDTRLVVQLELAPPTALHA